MYLLEPKSNGDFGLAKFVGDDIPRYAILSHTWGSEDEEVTFRDIMDGTGKNKAGYGKIKFCGEQAAINKLQYFWVDTCCIDKSSSSELQESINSMFRWYRDAARCYVYLSDVTIDNCQNSQPSQFLWEPAFRASRWFTRGWTLQELIAPAIVEFYSVEGKLLGDKISLEQNIHEVTGIAIRALRGSPLTGFTVSERMSWAADRETTRKEDKAYSLLGIFNIYMPLIYGEGRENALMRLHEHINKSSIRLRETPCVPSSNLPFRRDADFVERGTILNQINQKCAVPGSRTALVGLGGIGKSQLAIEFAYRIRERSPETWVFWVHASNAARFEQSYRQIADKVKIPGHKDPKANVLALVHDWLQNEDKEKWMLILDNVDDAAFFFEAPSNVLAGQKSDPDVTKSQPLVTYLPQCESGSVLITTRTLTAALSLVEESDTITIGPMDEEDAALLFQKKLRVPDDGEDVAELVAALEFMPLAIVQTAAYIARKAPRCSVRQYIKKFQRSDKEKANLLDLEGGRLRRDWEAKSSIITTWQISFDHIRQLRPSAADLLSLMSFFDRQGIPESLIRNRNKPRGSESGIESEGENDEDDESCKDDEFEDDIQALQEYSFISFSVDTTAFEMHALVQLATRNWLKTHGQLERWKQQYIKILYEDFPIGEIENWGWCAVLYPHAKAAMTQRPKGKDSLQEWAALLYNAAWYAWRRGVFADVEKMSAISTEVRKTLLGLEHAETLRSMNMVCSAFYLGGRWKEAEHLQVQVVEMRKKIFGVEHPATLVSMSDLALTYGKQGRLKKAEDLQLQAMESSKRVLGVEHPDTLAIISNLAWTYSEQGRLKEAEDLQLQVMELSKRVLGVEHLHTLISVDNLALTYSEQGRLKEAEDLQLQVMEASKRVLGVEHPDTLDSISNLAWTYHKQGRLKEAEKLAAQAIEMKKRILGAEHPSTLTSMHNLASTYISQSRLKEAGELAVQAMETSKRVLGVKHPDTLIGMDGLARIRKKEDLDEEAVAIMKECVRLRECVLGLEHPSTSSSRAVLIEWEMKDPKLESSSV